MVNTIVWGNKSTTSTGYLENSTSSATTQVTYSIVEKGFAGTGNLSTSPAFVSSGSYLIGKASPAFNSADPKTGDYGLPGLDLGLMPRRTFRKYDRGAYEYQCTESDATAASLEVTQCKGYTSSSGKLLTKTGVYTDVISNYNGCDSIITISLQINETDTTMEVTACQSFKLNGKEYNQLGNL
ncbi:MAG: hypothetical protein HYZ16_11000 [Bacteroidetes bacterium]|nr:hypothetical protein [Bacteroidota bacterium]